MSVEGNKALVRYYFDELNKGNIRGVEECLAPSFVRYSVSGDKVDKARWVQGLVRIGKTWPDIHRTIDDLIAEGDKMAICFTWRATDTVGSESRRPTGGPVVVPEVYITRFEVGKIAEFRQVVDLLGFRRQLGTAPPEPPSR